MLLDTESAAVHHAGVVNFAVLSDVHLGCDPAVDEFGHSEHEFLEFLDHLEATHERVFLNGDIYEGLRGRRLGTMARRAEVHSAQKRYRTIADRLSKAPYYQSSGNHDPDTTEQGLPQFHRIEVDKSVIVIVHGHEFDRINRYAPGLSPLVNWMNAWSSRWFGRDMDDGLYQLEAWLLGIRENPAEDAFQGKAIRYAQMVGAQVIITGHTHTGGVWSHSDVVYANSGTCSLGRYEWLSVDTHTRMVSFYRGWSTEHAAQSVHWEVPEDV